MVDTAEASGPRPVPAGRWTENPYLRFIQSEFWAGTAGVAVYAIFRAAAWLIEMIDSQLPLQDPAAARFLAQVLSWGAALGGAATFALITVYQLAVLLRRLWQEVQDDS
jgi:hypothetical protein